MECFNVKIQQSQKHQLVSGTRALLKLVMIVVEGGSRAADLKGSMT